MGFGQEYEGRSLVIVHPPHPIRSRSRNKRRKWPLFWSMTTMTLRGIMWYDYSFLLDLNWGFQIFKFQMYSSEHYMLWYGQLPPPPPPPLPKVILNKLCQMIKVETVYGGHISSTIWKSNFFFEKVKVNMLSDSGNLWCFRVVCHYSVIYFSFCTRFLAAPVLLWYVICYLVNWMCPFPNIFSLSVPGHDFGIIDHFHWQWMWMAEISKYTWTEQV